MKCTTLIPMNGNDGKPVAEEVTEEVLAMVWEKFPDTTIDGQTQGRWEHEGTVYQDNCFKLVIACHNDRLFEVLELVKKIGKRLGQKAMYLEIQYYDGVRIISID